MKINYIWLNWELKLFENDNLSFMLIKMYDK